MGRGRHRDGDGLHLGQQARPCPRRRACPSSPATFVGPGCVHVVHPHQAHVAEAARGGARGAAPVRPRRRRRPAAVPSRRTPRSLDSTNARNRSTSGNAGRSVRARSSACDRFRSELKKRRYARLSAAHGLAGEAGPLESDGIEAVELHRIAHRLHVRRDVLVDARAAAHERVGADGDELMHGVEPAENRPVVDGDVPGALRRVGDDHVVADVTVVRQVHVRHDEAAGAHGGLERLRRCRG